MHLYISPVNGLIFVIGCLVGYAVYHHGKKRQQDANTSGDLVAAIGCVLAVVTVLAFLLGSSDASSGEGDRLDPPASSPVTASP